MLGTCRLCQKEVELQESHIIPAFIYRWLKETSGTGYFRVGRNPNRRVQDGLKEHWLCLSCEKLFNIWETQFANNIFHPLNADGGARIRYEDWLLKFCASISWRTLNYIKENTVQPEHCTNTDQTQQDRALEIWAKFLLGKTQHPGLCEMHLLPLDTIADTSMNNLPATINRYFLRAIDVDVVSGGDTNFVFSKLGKIIILGFVSLPYPDQWIGTKIHVHKGFISPRHYVMPKQFADYLSDRAQNYGEMYGKMSDRQRKKIGDTIRENPEKFLNSECFKAMTEDVRRFGAAAFAHNQPKSNKISEPDT